MDRMHLYLSTFALALTACATAPSSRASGDATIVRLADAPRAVAPPKTAEIAHLARGENAYVGLLTLQPLAKVPVHRDATEEYIHVLRGSGRMTIDGATTPVGPGDTIYMPAGAEVSFENGDEELVGLQIFAGPAPAAKYDGWVRR